MRFSSPLLFPPPPPRRPLKRHFGCEVGVLLTLQKHRKNSSDPKVT